jgi:hypothetical protein
VCGQPLVFQEGLISMDLRSYLKELKSKEAYEVTVLWVVMACTSIYMYGRFGEIFSFFKALP